MSWTLALRVFICFFISESVLASSIKILENSGPGTNTATLSGSITLSAKTEDDEKIDDISMWALDFSAGQTDSSTNGVAEVTRSYETGIVYSNEALLDITLGGMFERSQLGQVQDLGPKIVLSRSWKYGHLFVREEPRKIPPDRLKPKLKAKDLESEKTGAVATDEKTESPVVSENTESPAVSENTASAAVSENTASAAVSENVNSTVAEEKTESGIVDEEFKSSFGFSFTGKKKDYLQKAPKANQQDFTIAQTHLEAALNWDPVSWLGISGLYGKYTYDKDVAGFYFLLNLPFVTTARGSDLVNGFSSSLQGFADFEYGATLTFRLTEVTSIDVGFTKSQMVVDRLWDTTYDISFNSEIGENTGYSIGGSTSVPSDNSAVNNSGNISLSYFFQ